jgi:6-methylsalicylate decarboxylase
MNTRRAFIGGLSASLLQAQRGRPHRIDIHHHAFAPEYRAAVEAARAGALAAWTPELSLAEMDKGGIQMSMLSSSPPGLAFADTAQAQKLARIVNEYWAKLVSDHPGKFGIFTALPLPDIDGSLKEIEYGLDTLKAPGVGLMTSYGNQWLGDKAFAPVWEELNRRKAVVYTHPNTPSCCGALNDELGPGPIEWATDTTRTMASLLFSGTASKYPDIRWIFSHGGGTVPFLLSRFTRQESDMKERDKRLPNGVLFEIKKFHYDTAQANHPGALAALLKVAPVSQVLFGTDFPYRTSAEEIGGLSAQRFSLKDLRAIEHGNAARLLAL